MDNVIPLLFRPRLLSIKNRWLRSANGVTKELVALAISALTMSAVYLSTRSALHKSTAISANDLALPATPLAIAVAGITTMLLLSAIVYGFSALFLSRDLDLVFSSPITRHQLLTSKLMDISLSSGWMISTFGLPALLAWGNYVNASVIFYIGAPILFLTLFIPIVIAAMITALLLATILPAQRGREVFLTLFIMALGTFCLSLSAPSVSPELSPFANYAQSLATVTSAVLSPWSPTTLCANALTELANAQIQLALTTAAAFIAGAVALWAILVALAQASYEFAFANAHGRHSSQRLNSRVAQRIARICLPLARSSTRAIATKEFKIFSRDLSHTVQLGLLLAICFIYLHSFQALRHPNDLEADAVLVWNTFLLVINVVMSSIIVISICSRFVFPSVSLEGTSFWIMLASPLSHGEYLRAKFKGWLAPLTLISAVIFSSGAMALQADRPLVLISLASGLIVSYGIVGLAIGLGAVFAHFDADHSSQVSSSLGGLIFVVSSTLLVAVNIIPLIVIFAGYILFPDQSHSHYTSALKLYLPLTVLIAINGLTTAISLQAGRRALRRASSPL